MTLFLCPYLKQTIELTEERRRHIAERHPDTLPEYESQLTDTLATPDSIHGSKYDEQAMIFSKWFDTIKSGRYLMAVVVSAENPKRSWITVYTSRKMCKGEPIWTKS